MGQDTVQKMPWSDDSIPPWSDDLDSIPNDPPIIPNEPVVILNQQKWERDKATIKNIIKSYLSGDPQDLITYTGQLLFPIGGPHILYPWYILMYIIRCFGDETMNIGLTFQVSSEFEKVNANMFNFVGMLVLSSRGDHWGIQKDDGLQRSFMFTHPSLGMKIYAIEWYTRVGDADDHHMFFFVKSIIVHHGELSEGRRQHNSEGYQAVLLQTQEQREDPMFDTPVVKVQASTTSTDELENRMLNISIFSRSEI